LALTAGTRLGVYEITAQIGEGGMGRVYRARDTKLNRDVAIKVLPDTFASDIERLARFTREAQTLASLNHPNIAHIYGLDRQEGREGTALTATAFIVMELVEGEDLSLRVARGAIPVADALPIAKQIADALEAAHEQGIIHRDLKPANIKLRPDGTVKVLDFGLAKAMDPVGNAANMSQSPTITTPAMMTGVGVILGTAAYMSPEQARGKTVDKRTDIWSFGCVLYQMLTGRSAFAGETVSDTIVAVLEREPDWNVLPDATLPTIRRLLQRCLEKDPKRRLHDVADVRLEVEDALATPTSGGSAGPGLAPGVIGAASSRASPRTLVWAAVTVAMAVAVIALAALALRRPVADLRPLRLSIVPPAGTTFTAQDISATPNFAMSPDGSRLAFVAVGARCSPATVGAAA
jgi:serine/threonine protein kinase